MWRAQPLHPRSNVSRLLPALQIHERSGQVPDEKRRQPLELRPLIHGHDISGREEEAEFQDVESAAEFR